MSRQYMFNTLNVETRLFSIGSPELILICRLNRAHTLGLIQFPYTIHMQTYLDQKVMIRFKWSSIHIAKNV